MSYLQLIRTLTHYAQSNPNVNTVAREFLDLNREDTKYSAVVIQDNTHNTSGDFIVYNFYIGYIDRLTADEANRDEIVSTGIQVITNIANALNATYDTTLGAINVVKERFTASCAGVYATLNIYIPFTDCYTDYNIEESNFILAQSKLGIDKL